MNLLTTHSVDAVAKDRLYSNTILKLPNHSMLPKSPRRSKFVIPETKYSIGKQSKKNKNKFLKITRS